MINSCQNLNLADCIELEQDIKMYLSLERSPINVEFWEVSNGALRKVTR